MTGILIVTHSNLCFALIEAAEFIIGEKPDKIAAVSIDLHEDTELLRKKISDGIKKVRWENGVIILTDMFGGTPSNLSYAFLEEGRVEVLSGVNLPILLKAIETRMKKNVTELASCLESFGKNSVSLASGILKGKKKERSVKK